MTIFAIIAGAALLYFAVACFVGRELKATGDAMDVTQERWEKPSEPHEPEVNVLGLAKGTERYVFVYTDAHRADTLRTLGRYASDPELSFTWYDAATLSQKIRQDAQPAA